MVSMARIPVTIGSAMCSRSSGLPGALIQAVMRGRTDGRFAVDRPAETIQYPADQIGAYGDLGVVLTGDDAVVQLDAIDFFERHGEHVAVAETDDLSAHAAPAGSDHLAEIARPRRPGRAKPPACRPARPLRPSTASSSARRTW